MGAWPLSSSVTVDWRVIREPERQACLALRAELAQLQAREKQLRIRGEAVSAAHGGRAEGPPGRAARSIGRLDRTQPAGQRSADGPGAQCHGPGPAITTFSGTGATGCCRADLDSESGLAMAPAPGTGPDIDLAKLREDPAVGRAGAPPEPMADIGLPPKRTP